MNFGLYKDRIQDVGADLIEYKTSYDKKPSFFENYFSFKRFQYFGAVSDDYIFGVAFADIRFVGAVFAYVFRKSDGKMQVHQFKMPLAFGLNLTSKTSSSESSFKFLNNSIKMSYELNTKKEEVFSLKGSFGKSFEIDAKIKIPKNYMSLNLLSRAGYNGWVYAQKVAGLPVEGNINCTFGEFDFKKQNTFGHHDFSSGRMRRETFWNWACISDKDIGLNVSWGVNETGFSENCIWIKGELFHLPQVQFEFDRFDENSPWKIKSTDENVDLEFKPIGLHKEKLNLYFIGTNFKQFFGYFKGTIKVSEMAIKIDKHYGFVEDHYSKW